MQDKFTKRHVKQKECARILEQRESKKTSDPAKERKRAKKFEAKLKPTKAELSTATDALIVALTDFKLSYLDWMEPIIHVAAQMRLQHPEHIVDAFLRDAALEELRSDMRRSADKLRSSFALLNSDESGWERLSLSLDSFVQFPLAVVYFKRFAEQEHVSESFYFYQEAKRYKSLWRGSLDGDSTVGAALALARQIVSLFLDEGSKQEINVPQSLKMSSIKQLKDGVTETMFDKPLEAISEMLEDTFHHFLTSDLARQLQQRLDRIHEHHANLRTTGTVIPPPGATREDTNDGDNSLRRRRPRSGSANAPAQRNSIFTRSSSSGLIATEITKTDQESPTQQSGILHASVAVSASSGGKSNTAPLPQFSRRSLAPGGSRENLLQIEITRDHDALDTSPRQDPAPVRASGGMKHILATLTGMLGPKPSKEKKKRSINSDGTPASPTTPSEFSAAAQLATELGPLATRHFCLLSSHLAGLINNPRGADFIILCGPEKTPFHCHSVIMNARWPMLLREYHGILTDIAKGMEATIEFPTVDPDTFTLALEYIYTGTLNVSDLTDRKLGVLTDFAKFRKVPGLKELATSHLVSRQPTSRIVSSIAAYVQSSSNTGEMLRLENDTKYESYIAALASRASDLIQLQLFDLHQLHKLRRIDMIHLIRRDDFSVMSERSVFELVTTWADKVSGNDQDILMENLSFLVAHVRLPLMTTEELQWIESLGWVPKNMMREAYKFKETGVCTHPSRARPRKLIVPSSNSHSLETSSASTSSTVSSSTLPLYSISPTTGTSPDRYSLILSDQDATSDGALSPATIGSNNSSGNISIKKKEKGGSTLPSPTSQTTPSIEPASPPLVRREKRAKRADSDVTTPPLLRGDDRGDNTAGVPTMKRPKKNKAKQDASPLLRTDSEATPVPNI